MSCKNLHKKLFVELTMHKISKSDSPHIFVSETQKWQCGSVKKTLEGSSVKGTNVSAERRQQNLT